MRHTQEQESGIGRVEIEDVDGHVHVSLFSRDGPRIIMLKFAASDAEKIRDGITRAIETSKSGSAFIDKPCAHRELGRLMAIVLQDEADVSPDDLKFARRFALVWDNYLKEWVYSPSVLNEAKP